MAIKIKKLLYEKETESFCNALDTIFTDIQKEIIFKKFFGKQLSKTEKEYYSRVVKSKLKAIANSKLFEICKLIALE